MNKTFFLEPKRIHVAIMRKEWRLTEKILSGEKIIESRWYLNRYPPWDKIAPGDTIYFKNSGEPVKIVATCKKVVQFFGLTPGRVKSLLDKYYKADGITKSELKNYYKKFKDKQYCVLVFLKDVKEVKPFEIDKSGFGAMAAWLAFDSLEQFCNRTMKIIP